MENEMKKILIMTALTLASMGAFAQSTATQTSSQQQASNAAASNAGVTTGVTINMPATTQRALDASIGDQTVHYDYGTQVIKNTPSMGTSNLTTSNDTCMGSSTVGGALPGVGLSIGTTWVDENCNMLKQSRELYNMGQRGASIARLCMDSKLKESLEMTGTICPQSMTEEERADVYKIKPRKIASVSTATQANVSTEPTDKYMRMRQGLPPLAGQ
jgi:hypothetical protein